MQQDFLDNFKESWNEQKQEKVYDQSQIFGMLHRKSMNSVKWIFIISVIEFLLGFFASIFYLFPSKMNEVHRQLFGENYMQFEIFNFLNLGVVLVFVYFFYCSFKRISIKSSVNQLMKDIVKFRKVAHWYIYYNLFGLALVILFMFSNRGDAFFTDQDISEEQVFIVKLIMVAMITIFVFLYYFFIYGIFLRSLKRNLKRLNKMEV